MRRLLLVVVTGCTTHHRLTVGPSYAVSTPEPAQPDSPPSDLGLDAAGEVTLGEDHLRLVIAGAARAGHGVTGGGFRGGLTLGMEPRPWAVRGTLSVGPAFTSKGGRLDVRAGLGVDYGLITDDTDRTGDKRTTLGAELFVSTIGTGDDRHLMIGLGLSVGAFHHQTLALAAAPPHDE